MSITIIITISVLAAAAALAVLIYWYAFVFEVGNFKMLEIEIFLKSLTQRSQAGKGKAEKSQADNTGNTKCQPEATLIKFY